MTRPYVPGRKPFEAAAILLVRLRVRRSELSAFHKAGFTLLEKRGLVSLSRGEYRPEGSFWDDVERLCLTVEGAVSDTAKSIERRS